MVKDMIRPAAGAFFAYFDITKLKVALGTLPVSTAPTLAALKKAAVPALPHGKPITLPISFTR